MALAYCSFILNWIDQHSRSKEEYELRLYDFLIVLNRWSVEKIAMPDTRDYLVSLKAINVVLLGFYPLLVDPPEPKRFSVKIKFTILFSPAR